MVGALLLRTRSVTRSDCHAKERLKRKFVVRNDKDPDIDDIIRAIVPITDSLKSARKNAIQRRLCLSQFEEECLQPKTALIQHHAST
ncbi:hypothetical protein BDN71DRAFT_1457239 [Pleurotus eryngii]|uniref:Uncharacterized protein n=1 Tax=Pleurotus eryngii TaxID=5323 RepID=A0A9P6D167_PLEER|nr:hypothetical protein BDN71DRAFT_1457239 [Pleurotus eryngii]